MIDTPYHHHKAAEGITHTGVDATVNLIPPEQQLSLLAIAANSVLSYLENHRDPSQTGEENDYKTNNDKQRS